MGGGTIILYTILHKYYPSDLPGGKQKPITIFQSIGLKKQEPKYFSEGKELEPKNLVS